MQLEAVEPTHGGGPLIGDTREYLKVMDGLVLADPDRGRVYKRPGAIAQTTGLQKQDHSHQVLLHKSGEPVVGDRVGEGVPHVHLEIEKIKVIEGPKTVQLEKDRYGDNLALGDYLKVVSLISDKPTVDHLFMFLTKFIGQTTPRLGGQ